MIATNAPDVRLLGLRFSDLDLPETLRALTGRDPAAPFEYVVTPNADHLVRLHRAHGALDALYEGAGMTLLDSRVVHRLARMVGLKTPRVLTGSDLTQALFETGSIGPDTPVTVIGARDAVADTLVGRFGLRRMARHNPPMGFERDPAEIRRCVEFVLAHPAPFTVLAVGSPRQEIVARAVRDTGRATGIGLCVGASLDFLAGVERRAPRFLQRMSLEWAYRLALNPRRMARRYLVEDPVIAGLLIREGLQQRQLRTAQDRVKIGA